jgi:fatty acid/phospholipid biosynthesis enzyme
MRKLLGRLLLLGAAAGAVYALRNYLQDSTGAKRGDVQIVLDTGATVEPDPAEAQEFADIARKVLEIGGEAR